ncbi:hypothetical protein Pelo_2197 [Pelomyxa schiedti]|nr:hypothetical protein Pelo_2197 [Pelomyxa schiedti]
MNAQVELKLNIICAESKKLLTLGHNFHNTGYTSKEVTEVIALNQCDYLLKHYNQWSLASGDTINSIPSVVWVSDTIWVFTTNMSNRVSYRIYNTETQEWDEWKEVTGSPEVIGRVAMDLSTFKWTYWKKAVLIGVERPAHRFLRVTYMTPPCVLVIDIPNSECIGIGVARSPDNDHIFLAAMLTNNMLGFKQLTVRNQSATATTSANAVSASAAEASDTTATATATATTTQQEHFIF